MRPIDSAKPSPTSERRRRDAERERDLAEVRAAGRRRSSRWTAAPAGSRRRPPASASSTDSKTNDVSTLRRRKPSARSVPISRVRAETIAYIVFIAPNTAPTPMTRPTKRGQREDAGRDAVRLLLVERALLLDLHPDLRVALQLLVERGQRRRIGEPHGERLIAAAAVERRRHHLGVAPDLALEAAAVGLEDADDLPVLLLQADRVADARRAACADSACARR